MITTRASRLLISLFMSLAACVAGAQQYPTRPVQVMVPFPAGTGTDLAARVFAERLSQSMGQQFVVVNRPGAGGSIGAGMVAAAAPDGYTLLVNSSAQTLYPSLQPDLKFDPAKDLVAVASLVDTDLILVASPSKGWKTLADMLAYAKANPGKLTYASAGVGTSTQMAFAKLVSAAGIQALHVPFKGTNEGVAEVVSGRVDAIFGVGSSALQLVKANQLVALAIANAKRSRVLPDVPTTVEAGVPDSTYPSWTGMLAPKGTPRAIIEKLNEEVVVLQKNPDVVQRLVSGGLAPLSQSSAQFQAQMESEFISNAKLVKSMAK